MEQYECEECDEVINNYDSSLNHYQLNDGTYANLCNNCINKLNNPKNINEEQFIPIANIIPNMNNDANDEKIENMRTICGFDSNGNEHVNSYNIDCKFIAIMSSQCNKQVSISTLFFEDCQIKYIILANKKTDRLYCNATIELFDGHECMCHLMDNKLIQIISICYGDNKKVTIPYNKKF